MSEPHKSGIEGLLGPELLSPDAGFGYSCERVDTGDHIELVYSCGDASFTVWIERAGSGKPCYLRTKRFAVGYRGDPPDERAFDLLNVIAARIRGNEDSWEDPLDPTVVHDRGSDPVVSAGRLEIRITDRCNEKCPFCNTDEHVQNLITSPEQIRSGVRRARDLGARQVVFTGGEPTLARDLPSFVALAKEAGLRVWIQTNGILPGREGFWDRFAADDGEPVLPDVLLVSFHTQYPDRLQALTGVGGTMGDKVRTVKSALDRGITVGLSHVISRLNLDETGDFPTFVASEFGRGLELCFSLMAPTGHAIENLSLMLSVLLGPAHGPVCVRTRTGRRHRGPPGGPGPARGAVSTVPACRVAVRGAGRGPHLSLAPVLHASSGPQVPVRDAARLPAHRVRMAAFARQTVGDS